MLHFHSSQPSPSSSIRGEQALWRAVITQALMDASSQSKKMELQYEKSQAHCWLTGFSEDFRTVCDYADYDPHYVRENAVVALERNCQWRAPAERKVNTVQQSAPTSIPQTRRAQIPTIIRVTKAYTPSPEPRIIVMA